MKYSKFRKFFIRGTIFPANVDAFFSEFHERVQTCQKFAEKFNCMKFAQQLPWEISVKLLKLIETDAIVHSFDSLIQSTPSQVQGPQVQRRPRPPEILRGGGAHHGVVRAAAGAQR